MKYRAVFRLALAPLAEAGRGDVRMTEPLLHLGDVCLLREGVDRSSRAHRMHTYSDCFSADTRRLSILDDDIPVDGAGIEMHFECAGAIVCHWAEQEFY